LANAHWAALLPAEGVARTGVNIEIVVRAWREHIAAAAQGQDAAIGQGARQWPWVVCENPPYSESQP
jgi:hypothetical protein